MDDRAAPTRYEPGLLTAYDRRIRRLQTCVRALDHASATNDDAAIRLEWDRLCEDVVAPNEELLGLTYDWLACTGS